MPYVTTYPCEMTVEKSPEKAQSKYQSVQFDRAMIEATDEMTTSTGLSRTDFLRRVLVFLQNLHGVELREILGVNAPEIKHPDVVALLWEKLRGSQSHQPPAQSQGDDPSDGENFGGPAKKSPGPKPRQRPRTAG